MDKIRSFFQQNKNVAGTLLFAAFMLIQFVTLRLANQAGRGYLETEIQERVYLFIQVAVIAGYLLHMMFHRLNRSRAGGRGVIITVICSCAAGAGIMLFSYEGSPVYLVITGVTVLCLGFIIGAVYLKLSEVISDGARAGTCIGIGYASAVALQYVFQLQWTVRPVLAILLTISFAALTLILLSMNTEGEPTAQQNSKCVSRKKLVFAAVITLAMLLFTTYYNSYIHHLQIASGYTDYNVYSWPRLLMIPTMLLFGVIGDVKNGKFLPISSLCVVVIALLNTALLGRETYLLNMCLYYISFSAIIAYYHLTFLRLAPGTKHPSLWAAMGRMIDSFSVVLSFALGFSQLSAITVLIIDIAALALILIFMAVNGDFNFTESQEPLRIVESVSVHTIDVDPFPVVQERYGVTPSEMKVLRELVETDDKQEVMAARLGISVSTLRHHITSIYKKTGVQSRLSLSNLVDSCRRS